MCGDVDQVEGLLRRIENRFGCQYSARANTPHRLGFGELLKCWNEVVELEEAKHRGALSPWKDQSVYGSELIFGSNSDDLSSNRMKHLLMRLDAPLKSEDTDAGGHGATTLDLREALQARSY